MKRNNDNDFVILFKIKFYNNDKQNNDKPIIIMIKTDDKGDYFCYSGFLEVYKKILVFPSKSP